MRKFHLLENVFRASCQKSSNLTEFRNRYLTKSDILYPKLPYWRSIYILQEHAVARLSQSKNREKKRSGKESREIFPVDDVNCTCTASKVLEFLFILIKTCIKSQRFFIALFDLSFTRLFLFVTFPLFDGPREWPVIIQKYQ